MEDNEFKSIWELIGFFIVIFGFGGFVVYMIFFQLVPNEKEQRVMLMQHLAEKGEMYQSGYSPKGSFKCFGTQRVTTDKAKYMVGILDNKVVKEINITEIENKETPITDYNNNVRMAIERYFYFEGLGTIRDMYNSTGGYWKVITQEGSHFMVWTRNGELLEVIRDDTCDKK